jgi:hypothetical protein
MSVGVGVGGERGRERERERDPSYIEDLSDYLLLLLRSVP